MGEESRNFHQFHSVLQNTHLPGTSGSGLLYVQDLEVRPSQDFMNAGQDDVREAGGGWTPAFKTENGSALTRSQALRG